MARDTEQKELNSINIPKIVMDINPKEELGEFYWALHYKKMPDLRKSILTHRYFQRLKESLGSTNIESEDQEKQIIWDFLTKAHQRDRERIEGFLEFSQRELNEKSMETLIALAKLMDYEWPENPPEYRAIPVLLPFSPFGDNDFYFSVLGVAQGKDQKAFLDVAIHEISHMILFAILEKYHPEIPSDDTHMNVPIFYLKEILAPVLMNQHSLRKFLDLHDHPEDYLGNPDIEEIYIAEGDSQEKVQVSRYFQNLYEQMRYQEHKTFPEILDKMLKIIQPMEKELAKRCDLWNEHGWKIFTDQEIARVYSEPIKIEKIENI